MNLLPIFERYEKEQKSPLSFEMFSSIEWNENNYFIYLSLIEAVHSAMIVNSIDFRGIKKEDKMISFTGKNKNDLLYLTINNLESYLQSFNDTTLDFETIYRFFNAVPLYTIKYLGNRKQFFKFDNKEPNCSLIYKSFEDFRITLEEQIYYCLKNKPIEVILNFDSPDKQYTIVKNLGKENLIKQKNEIENLLSEFESQSYSLDLSSYSKIQKWADVQSRNLYNCEDLEDLLTEIEESIELYDSCKYTTNKILYVHKGNNIICKKEHHNIISVNAVFKTLKNTEVKLNINYCNDCKRFFISKSEYDFYRTKYPGLLANFKFVDENFDSDVQSREEFSLLALNGYSVRKDGPSKENRHKILEFVMTNDIMDKYKIIDHITMLIETNGLKSNMYNAVSKWEDDLEFVRNFNTEYQDNYTIDEIRKYKK